MKTLLMTMISFLIGNATFAIDRVELWDEYVREFNKIWREPFDNEWEVDAIFLDMNGDGVEEALLSCDCDRYRDGTTWHTMAYLNGKCVQTGWGSEPDCSVFAYKHCFYVLTLTDGTKALIVKDAEITRRFPDGSHNGRQTHERGDYVLTMSPNGILRANKLTGGVKRLRSNTAFETLTEASVEQFIF